MPDLEILTPLRIRGVTLPNRVVRTAHGTNIGRGRLDDDLIAYHAARAVGGVGLTILEAASVHRTDTGTLRLHDERCVDDFARLTDAVAGTGMRVFAQLGHLGHDGVPMDPDAAPWAPSALTSAATGRRAVAMTRGDIDELIGCFARVAGWVKLGGLHGVEVHAAHGYLLEQFLSPVTNQRTDRYGGSWENRSRLVVEVLTAVREAVGVDFVVGVRTGADATDDGVQPEDCADLVALLEERGLIDYVNVTYGSSRAPHKIIGAMHEPTGYELATSEVVTKRAHVPTLVTGRFRTLEEANEVVRSGLADMVGMTRAHIADPDIVRKTRHGRAHEIRPCIACNQGCVGGLGLGRLACAVNPDVGFERDRVDAYRPGGLSRRVAVIGAGPAGLEVARVAAQRGHEVTVFEAADVPGGRITDARRLPHRELIGESVDWLVAETARLGVALRCGTRVGPDSPLLATAEVVVVAAGASRPRFDDLLGGDGPPTGVRSATVVDRLGDYQAIGLAERLAGWGVDVTVVAAGGALGTRIARELVVVPALNRLARLPGRVVVIDPEDPGAEDAERADLVVRVDATAAVFDLGWTTAEVHVVGDAVRPANLWSAIRSGNAVGRSI